MRWLFLLILPSLASCTIEHDVQVEIVAGASVGDVTHTMRIFAERCPGRADDVALDRVGPSMVYEQLYRPGEAVAIGELPKGRYCVSVLLRDRGDCAPAAYGEALVQLGDSESITVALQQLSWLGQVCPDGVGCSDGFCSGPPEMCAPATCGGLCCPDGTCSAEGSCDSCGGRCEADTQCIAGECRPLQQCDGTTGTDDPFNCGECEYACNPALQCIEGLCSAGLPSPLRLSLFDQPSGDRTDLAVTIAWVSIQDAFNGSDGRPALLGAMPAQSLRLAGADPGGGLYSLEVFDLQPLGAAGEFPFELGLVVVFVDEDGDLALDPNEYETPRELGIGRQFVVYAHNHVDRNGFIQLPEGAITGPALYQRSGGLGAGLVAVPAESPNIEIEGCFATAGGMADPDCLASVGGF